MANTKHTEGPWVATPYGGVMPAGADYLVASCGGKSGNYRDWEANARLIAAAPELLAVLEHASHINSFREFNDYLPTIRAAIAKAQGQ